MIIGFRRAGATNLYEFSSPPKNRVGKNQSRDRGCRELRLRDNPGCPLLRGARKRAGSNLQERRRVHPRFDKVRIWLLRLLPERREGPGGSGPGEAEKNPENLQRPP